MSRPVPRSKSDGGHDHYMWRAALVAECRQLFGKRAARDLWRELGLPLPTGARLTRDSALQAGLEAFIRQSFEPAPTFLRFSAIRAAHVLWCEREGVSLPS